MKRLIDNGELYINAFDLINWLATTAARGDNVSKAKLIASLTEWSVKERNTLKGNT